LTFKFANGADYFFHAKKMPGSHVILKTNSKDVPDRTFEEAASLAAFYSKAKNQDKVEVDYLEKKKCQKSQNSAKTRICKSNYTKLFYDYKSKIYVQNLKTSGFFK